MTRGCSQKMPFFLRLKTHICFVIPSIVNSVSTSQFCCFDHFQVLAPPNDDGTFLNTMNAVQTTQIVQSIGDGRSFSFLQDSELEQDGE